MKKDIRTKNTKSKNNNTITIDGVEIYLTHPDELNISVVGAAELQKQLLACWLKVEDEDMPLTPRLLGRPGVGKTTLAYSVGKSLGNDVYIYQCTMDTRPEDLIITPVISDNNTIRYQASPLVTAMVRGGVCVLDEGNRMMEKAWASLAPLFDKRRYVESITAGIKIKAHPDFRCAITMNNDSSTFEVPEYIMSRLQPQIFIDFPSVNEEKQILKVNLPFAPEKMITMMAEYLDRSHKYDEPFTSRDGIHILRYAMKLIKSLELSEDDAIKQAVKQILGINAVTYLNPDYKPKLSFDNDLNRLMYDKLYNDTAKNDNDWDWFNDEEVDDDIYDDEDDEDLESYNYYDDEDYDDEDYDDDGDGYDDLWDDDYDDEDD